MGFAGNGRDMVGGWVGGISLSGTPLGYYLWGENLALPRAVILRAVQSSGEVERHLQVVVGILLTVEVVKTVV